MAAISRWNDARPLQGGLQCVKMIPAIPFNIVLRLERARDLASSILEGVVLQAAAERSI